MLLFGLHAAVVGALFSRIAEIQRALGLDELAFGWVMVGLPAGFIAGTFAAAPISQALGIRRQLLAAFPLAALTPLLAGLSPGFWPLLAALAAFGAMTAVANLGVNVEADRLALATGRPMIARCHGAWGLGFLAVTSLGALAIRADVSPLAQFWGLFVLIGIATLILIAPLQPSPPRAHQRSGKSPLLALPDRASFLVMGFALSGIVWELITRSWSVIYLRDMFGTSDWVASLSLPVLVLAQTAGRFLSDGWSARAGEVTVARALSLITLAGGCLLVATASVPLALAACALIGLGTSVTFPMAMSALTRHPNRPAAESLAAFTVLQNVVGLVAPPAFGLAAASFDLRLALALLLPLPLIALIHARELRG